MLTVETSEQGVEKYVVDLKGPFDGCQFETLYYPNNDLITEIVDQQTGTPISAMKLALTVLDEENGQKSLCIQVADEWPKDMEDRQELLLLTAWYLSHTYWPRIWIEDKQFYDATDPSIKMPEVVAQMLGTSRMEAFYNGEEIELQKGLVLKTTAILMKNDDIKVEVKLYTPTGSKGWIDGTLREDSDKELVFEVTNWGGWRDQTDLDFTIKDDMFAFMKRYLTNQYGKVRIEDRDEIVEMPDVEVAGRTYKWLGF